jgi:hypothetical protein
VYINGFDGFRSFATERLMKHHGISKEKSLCSIKEMDWRYTDRENDLFKIPVLLMVHYRVLWGMEHIHRYV